MTTYEFPATLDCPRCLNPIVTASPVTRCKHPGFQKGMIVICANCGSALIVGDTQLEPLTANQIAALDMPSRIALQATLETVNKHLKK